METLGHGEYVTNELGTETGCENLQFCQNLCKKQEALLSLTIADLSVQKSVQLRSITGASPQIFDWGYES